MLEDALVELVQHIGGNGQMYVGEGKTSPERLLNPTASVEHHTLSFNSRGASTAVLPGVLNDLLSTLRGAQFSGLVIAELVCGTLTLRTRPILGASDEALLRIVGDVGRQDGEYLAYTAIPTRHLYALLSGFDEGTDDETHCSMENALCACFVFAFGETHTRDLGDGQIP